jgi:hypothetical protein
MLKKSFARPQRLQVIDLPLWGGAMRCQRSIRRDFFSSLLGSFPHAYLQRSTWYQRIPMAPGPLFTQASDCPLSET